MTTCERHPAGHGDRVLLRAGPRQRRQRVRQQQHRDPHRAGDTTAADACRARCRTAPRGNTITLTWGASTDTGGSGLAGYNVYRDGSLIATLGTVLSYQDTQPATATVSYFVRARDGAGNLSGNSNTVTRTGIPAARLHQRGAGQDR